MKHLAFAEGLSLPIDVVTQKIAFMGRTGSGKTYAATKLADLLLRAGAQVVAIDPVGVWWGLRLEADGKTPSDLELPIFGGLHGDIPLESTGGKLMADLIVDRALSCVLDVSQFESDAEKARFARDFADRFFYRKKAAPSAVHLFLEEAQEFVPQNPQRDDAKMLHVFERLIKLGRNFGIGVSLVSQRPQELNKKALNQTELLLAFQMTGPQERKAISAWVSEKGADEDVADILPGLKIGQPHVWSPQWLGISKTVKVIEKQTYNASSTPTFGAKAVESKPLGAIDLSKLQERMAATIEKAKSEDPKFLRGEVARLRRELEGAGKKNGQTITKAVVDQGAIDRAVERARDSWSREMRRLTGGYIGILRKRVDAIAVAARVLDEAMKPVEESLNNVATPGALLASKEHRLNPSSPVASLSGSMPERRSVGHARGDSRERPATQYTGEGVSRGQQRILDALAELKAFGIAPASRAQVGIIASYDLTGGTGSKHISKMIEDGLLSIPIPGALELTTEGERMAAPPPESLSLEDFHRAALSKLSPGEARILEYLISIYPEVQSRADVGTAVAYDLTGGTGSKHIAKLTTLGFVDIPRPGQLRAGELLYPEALV